MAELVPVEKRMMTLRTFFEQNRAKVATIMPKHFSADRQGQLLFTMVYKNPTLLECAPASLVGALMQGAMLGLEPVGPGGYWLVPFYQSAKSAVPARRNVTMIVDYRGLMGMARRTREVKAVDWREVRQGDEFKYEYGSTGFLKHVPEDKPTHYLADGKQVERPITHCYAYGLLSSGALVFEVMRKEDIEWHRDRYSKAASNGPWVTNFAEMGAKTCVRKLADKLPFDPLLSRAVEMDMKTEQGVPEDFGAMLGEMGEAGEGEGPREGKLATLTKELDTKPAGNGHTTVIPPKEGDEAPSAAVTVSSLATSPTTVPSAASEAPAAQAASAADPGVEGARQPLAGTAASRSSLMDTLVALYDDLELTGVKKRAQREFLWSRYVGAFSEEDAPPEKLQALIAELRKLAEQRKAKK